MSKHTFKIFHVTAFNIDWEGQSRTLTIPSKFNEDVEAGHCAKTFYNYVLVHCVEKMQHLTGWSTELVEQSLFSSSE